KGHLDLTAFADARKWCSSEAADRATPHVSAKSLPARRGADQIDVAVLSRSIRSGLNLEVRSCLAIVLAGHPYAGHVQGARGARRDVSSGGRGHCYVLHRLLEILEQR